MATAYQLKKWFKRYFLRSKKCIVQNVGQVYSVDKVEGYYNDLTEKITKGEKLAPDEIPQYRQDDGTKFVFSIGVFQYGLACYDMYLLNGEEKYKDKMFLCADWAMDNLEESGGWSTFAHHNPDKPYSSMAQGEGVSLLLRAYLNSRDARYLTAAEKAVKFLLTPVEQGGVCVRTEDELIFKEYTERPIVLNGWIFSLWGLIDYIKVTGDQEVQRAYEFSLATLEKYIPHYDLGYWTRYDYSERIASPFYHKLHIDQFAVMYDLTGREIFKTYLEKFQTYQKTPYYKIKAFVIKGAQKLRGK